MQHETGRPLELKLRGVGYKVLVARVGSHNFRVEIEAGDVTAAADVDVERYDRHSGQIVVNGERFRITTGAHGPTTLVDVDGVTQPAPAPRFSRTPPAAPGANASHSKGP